MTPDERDQFDQMRRTLDVLANTPAGKRALADAALRQRIRAEVDEVAAFIAASPEDAERMLRAMPLYKRRVFVSGGDPEKGDSSRASADWRELAARAATMSPEGREMLIAAIDRRMLDPRLVDEWSRPPEPWVKVSVKLRRGERAGIEVRTAAIKNDEIAYPGFELDGHTTHFTMPDEWADRLAVDAELRGLVEGGRLIVEDCDDEEAHRMSMGRRAAAEHDSGRQTETSADIEARTKRELEAVRAADAENFRIAREANHANALALAGEAARGKRRRGE